MVKLSKHMPAAQTQGGSSVYELTGMIKLVGKGEPETETNICSKTRYPEWKG
jgi:hypothetical protein